MAATAKKPAPKRAGSRQPKIQPRKADRREIAERAYFIHLEDGGSDELANWLRAERELERQAA